MPDLIELLSADHRRIAGLADWEAPDRSLVAELSTHLVVEAQLLYPSLLRSGNEVARRLADELLAHDHELELGLSRVDKGEGGPNLRQLFEAHVTEQQQAFDLLRAELPPSELDALGAEVGLTVEEAPEYPHPHLPSHGPLEPVADMLAALVDRVRDHLHRE